MNIDKIAKFAYIGTYLTNCYKRIFDSNLYFNEVFNLVENSDEEYLNFINFLHKNSYAEYDWCIAFKNYWNLHKYLSYVDCFRNFSKLENEAVFFTFSHFCYEELNKKVPENEITMNTLVNAWSKDFYVEIILEYDFLFAKEGFDDLLIENLPNIHLTLPKIDNKEEIEELIYALEDITTDDITMDIVKKLKDNLSIGFGINFKI